MRKKSILLISVFFLAIAAIAQSQPTGNLTIFSEDGDKFFLILNGERQNNTAQTNLRVEDLSQQYYNAKIIFTDNSLGEISKNYLQITDANGIFMDVTYKIKHDKNNGKMSLRYFSMVPVQQNYVAPANVTVMHFGNPVMTAPAGTTSVTQTTTTTTGTGAVGANVNMGGVNMNVVVTDPNINSTTQTTTTHTTTTSSSGGEYQEMEVNEHHHHSHEGCFEAYPMNPGDFSSALNTIKNEGFEESKLKTAKQIAGSNCLSTGQIIQICQSFGFEESKLDFAKFAYDHCTEPKNYFKINNVFSFSSSTDALNEYIQSRH